MSQTYSPEKESIKIEPNIVSYDTIIYQLNDTDKTASAIRSSNVNRDLFIPRSIYYESQEYTVTSISDKAFWGETDIEFIKFPPNSELRTIGKGAFGNCTSLKEITIPSSLVELGEGWCENTESLKYINLNPNNQHFKYYNYHLLLGRSGETEEFDTLIFANRNISDVIIPNYVKTIGPYAFDYCSDSYLSIKFESNSQLRKISKYAFNNCFIKSITIPSHTTEIGDFAFYRCIELKSFKFEENSELQTIGKKAFFFHKI